MTRTVNTTFEETRVAELDTLKVSVCRSPDDGVLLVEIIGPTGEADMNDNGSPRMRIWVNEALIYSEDGEVGDDLF